MLSRLLIMVGLRAGKGAVGARGEAEAAQYLQRAGYKVLDRNVRVPMGEADIVARSPDGVVVLVEVKTRVVDPARPRPKAESQVGGFKRRKLVAILRHLERANGWQRERKRIDVVAVEFAVEDQSGPPAAVRHLVNAVRL